MYPDAHWQVLLCVLQVWDGEEHCPLHGVTTQAPDVQVCPLGQVPQLVAVPHCVLALPQDTPMAEHAVAMLQAGGGAVQTRKQN